jgi:tRNA threonylcarbamoyladenosine biosynthesis protein TsaB
MPLLLSIETATEICSVCLHEGEQILSLKEVHKENSHVETITLLIREAFESVDLSLSELDAVAVSAGPGSYTGLRVGTSTAKGAAFGLDIPLIAIPTLDYLAHSVSDKAKDRSLIVPMIDARRMEIYTAFYTHDLLKVKELHNLIVEKDSFDTYLKDFDEIILLGNGAKKCKSLFSSEKFKYSENICSASHMVPLVYQAFLQKEFADTAYYSPLYYKSPNITTSKKPL